MEIVESGHAGRQSLLTGAGYRFLLGVTLLVSLHAALGWRARLAGSVADETWLLPVVNLIFLLVTAAGVILVGGVVAAAGARPARRLLRGVDAVAIGALVVAGMLVALDLARPARAARLVHPDHFDIPVAWDFVIVATYFLAAYGLGYLATRRDLLARLTGRAPLGQKLEGFRALPREASSPGRVLREADASTRAAAVALPTALLLYALAASILGALGAHPAWGAVLITPIFVVPTLIAGVALWTLVAALTGAPVAERCEGLGTARLARALGYLMPVLALYLFGELLLAPYAGDARHLVGEMLVGPYALLMLGGFVGGVIIPSLVLAVPRTRTPCGIALAACLVVAGVFVARWHLVVAGALGHAHRPGTPGGYVPGWPELAHTAAGYGVALLVGALALRGTRRTAPRGPATRDDASDNRTTRER